MSDDAPIKVRVFAEHGAENPVWCHGLVEDLTAFGVSAPLQAKMARLVDVFDRGVYPGFGWRTPAFEREYMELLAEIVDSLQAELGPGYVVTTNGEYA